VSVCVCLCVCVCVRAYTMWEPQQRGGLGLIWAVAPQIRRNK